MQDVNKALKEASNSARSTALQKSNSDSKIIEHAVRVLENRELEESEKLQLKAIAPALTYASKLYRSYTEWFEYKSPQSAAKNQNEPERVNIESESKIKRV